MGDKHNVHVNCKNAGGKPTLILLGLFLLHSLSYAAEIVEKKLIDFNVDAAIFTAFENNRSIQMQKANIKEATANKLFALSNFLPKAEIDYSYTHYDSLYSIPASSASAIDPRTFIGYKNDNLLTLSVEEEFFKGGAHVAAFKQSGLELISQRELYRATQLDVEYNVKRLFYGLLLAYEIERIARDLVTQAEAHYKEVLTKFDQGTASKFDLLQSKVHLSLVIPQLIEAQNSVELTKIEFKKLLTLNMQNDVTIKGALKFSPIEIGEEAFLMEALQRRPEMIVKKLNVDVEKWGIELAKATGVPQLAGDFAYYGRSNNMGTMMRKTRDNWYIGLKATLPLFDGLATPAKINEARAGAKDSWFYIVKAKNLSKNFRHSFMN